MKQTTLLSLLGIVALAVCSCNKGDNFGVKPSEQVAISIVAAANHTSQDDFVVDTRTQLADGSYAYYWTNGDKIGLFATNSAGDDLIVDDCRMINNNTAEKQLTTVFDGKLSTETYARMPEGEEYWYAAYYPYQLKASFTLATTTISGLTLPTVQKVDRPGVYGFRTDYDYMVASAVKGGTLATTQAPDVRLQFEHLFSAIRLYVKKDYQNGEIIKSVTLTAPEDVALTGDFEVNVVNRAVTFTAPSNSVTVEIAEGMGELNESDNCVWAFINPVDLSNIPLTLTVTTESGFQYTYTYSGTDYKQGSFHDLAFDIPKFEISGNIYTSFNTLDNSLDGSTIYYDNIVVSGPSPDANGFGYSVPIAETGVMYNNNRIPNNEPLTSFGYNLRMSSYTEWGEYNAQGYVMLPNGTIITSKAPNVHVTGIPFNKGVKSSGYGNNDEADGYYFGENNDVQGSINSTHFPWTSRNMDDITTAIQDESYVVSMPFHIPSTTSVVVRGYFSTSVTGASFEAGPVAAATAPSLKVSVSVPNITTDKGAYYEFPSFSLTPINNRVCLYDDEDGGALFTNWPFFRLFKVAVSYAN